MIAAALVMAAVTLNDAVTEALTKNPAVAGVQARTAVAEARLREARAAWLPRVDATETVVRGDNPVFVFGSLLEQGRFGPQHFDPAFLNDPGPLTNARLGVNVRFTVFDQFRRRNAIREARSGVEESGFGGEEVRQRIRLEAIARFYGLLLAAQKRDVAADAVHAAESDTAAMRDRLEQGLLVESDLLAAEVQLATLRQRLIETEGDLAVARAALATLMQRPVVEALEVAGTVPEKPMPEVALDGAIAQGLARRGEVRMASASAKRAALHLDTARGALLPRVDTFASWGASRGDPDRAIGVVVGVDLFDGGKLVRIAGARAGIEAARADEAATRDQVTMEVVAAWHRAHAARERIGVAAKSVEWAEAAARIVRDRHEHGLTTITEHLRAQTALLAARLELLAARYDALVGRAELLRAMGGLNDVEEFS